MGDDTGAVAGDSTSCLLHLGPLSLRGQCSVPGMDCEVLNGMVLSDGDFEFFFFLDILFCSCVYVSYWMGNYWGRTVKVFCHIIFLRMFVL